MKTCRSCKKQCANNAKTCPECGYRFTGTFTKLSLLLIGGLIVLIVLFHSNDDSSPRPPSATVQQASVAKISTKNLPIADQAYVTASLNYLRDANATGTRLATVWAGASQGTSTLEDCRSASRAALAEENALYRAYQRSRGLVPLAFRPVDQNIAVIHTKITKGLNRVLSYWVNGDLNAIQDGTDQYKDAIFMENSTIEQATEITREELK